MCRRLVHAMDVSIVASSQELRTIGSGSLFSEPPSGTSPRSRRCGLNMHKGLLAVRSRPVDGRTRARSKQAWMRIRLDLNDRLQS